MASKPVNKSSLSDLVQPKKSGQPVLCQRIGCSAYFTEDNNPEGCCRYHPGQVT